NNISPDCSVAHALFRMSTENTEYLIVLDENRKFLGLLTEHTIARRTIFNNRPTEDISVREMMNSSVTYTNLNDTIEHCMRLMKRYNTRYLPVFEGSHFRGIISGDDILEEAVSNRVGIFDEV